MVTSPSQDQNGNSINSKTYGNQIWSLESADVVTYRDGTPIPQVSDGTQWSNLTTGAWCYVNNSQSNEKLYNWYAVAGIHDNDPNTPNKEFAPEGWHVPTDAEWTELENYLIANGYNYDGTTEGNKIAKAMASTTGWPVNFMRADPAIIKKQITQVGLMLFRMDIGTHLEDLLLLAHPRFSTLLTASITILVTIGEEYLVVKWDLSDNLMMKTHLVTPHFIIHLKKEVVRSALLKTRHITFLKIRYL